MNRRKGKYLVDQNYLRDWLRSLDLSSLGSFKTKTIIYFPGLNPLCRSGEESQKLGENLKRRSDSRIFFLDNFERIPMFATYVASCLELYSSVRVGDASRIATRLIDQLWGKVRHRQFFGYAEDACNFHPGVKGRWYVVYRYLNLKHSGLVLAWKISKTEIELTRKLHP